MFLETQAFQTEEKLFLLCLCAWNRIARCSCPFWLQEIRKVIFVFESCFFETMVWTKMVKVAVHIRAKLSCSFALQAITSHWLVMETSWTRTVVQQIGSPESILSNCCLGNSARSTSSSKVVHEQVCFETHLKANSAALPEGVILLIEVLYAWLC